MRERIFGRKPLLQPARKGEGVAQHRISAEDRIKRALLKHSSMEMKIKTLLAILTIGCVSRSGVPVNAAAVVAIAVVREGILTRCAGASDRGVDAANGIGILVLVRHGIHLVPGRSVAVTREIFVAPLLALAPHTVFIFPFPRHINFKTRHHKKVGLV